MGGLLTRSGIRLVEISRCDLERVSRRPSVISSSTPSIPTRCAFSVHNFRVWPAKEGCLLRDWKPRQGVHYISWKTRPDRGHLNIALPVPRFIRCTLIRRPSCSFSHGIWCLMPFLSKEDKDLSKAASGLSDNSQYVTRLSRSIPEDTGSD